MMPSLADKCFAYLQKNVDASDAHEYKGKDHITAGKRSRQKAVKSESFVTIERSVLEN